MLTITGTIADDADKLHLSNDGSGVDIEWSAQAVQTPDGEWELEGGVSIVGVYAERGLAAPITGALLTAVEEYVERIIDVDAEAGNALVNERFWAEC
jgi:hypothetical protein